MAQGATVQRRRAPRPPTNLPAELQPLYGRDDDLALVRELLAAHRLVTLVGAGGIGKTRVGAGGGAVGCSASIADGVWLVELAPLADPALLPSAASRRRWACSCAAGMAPLDELVAALEPRQLLLVLDNCEHLLEAASLLAQALLTRTPHVRLLVTSQEPLKLPAEHLYRLGAARRAERGPGHRPGRRARLRRGAAVRRARAGARPALQARRTQRQGRRRHLPPPRRPGAGHRAGGRARAVARRARRARTPRRAPAHAHRRLAHRAAPPPDAARRARLEPRPAGRRGARGVPPARRVQRRLHDRGGAAGGRRRAARRMGGARSPRRRWSTSRWSSPTATDRPRYRLLESARAYALEKLAEARRDAGCWRAATPSTTRRASSGSTDALYAGTTHRGRLHRRAQRRARQLARGTGLGARAMPATPIRRWHCWRRPRTCASCCLRTTNASAGARLLSRALGRAGKSPEQAALHDYIELMWSVQGLRLAPSAPGSAPPALGALRALGRRATPGVRRAGGAVALRRGAVIWRRARRARRVRPARGARLARRGWPHTACTSRFARPTSPARCPTSAPQLEKLLARLEAAGEGETRAAFVVGTHLGEDSLLRGDFEEAAQRFGALAELGRRQRRDAYRMCFVLGSATSSRWPRLGRLDEARSAALEALPLLQHTGMRGRLRAGARAASRRAAARRSSRPGCWEPATPAWRSPAAAGCCSSAAPTSARLRCSKRRIRRRRSTRWIAEGASLGEEEFVRLLVMQA